MKKVLCTALFFAFLLPVCAQVKVISFKKLQTFLPSMEMKNFKRNKPTGETQTVMGFSLSEAKVSYEKIQKENDTAYVPVSYRFSIQDVSLYPMILAQFSMMQQDFERETETGYEKSFKLKDTYLGKLSVVSGEYPSCRLEVGVGNRFLVSAECDGSDDIKLLESMLASIDFEKLLQLQPDK